MSSNTGLVAAGRLSRLGALALQLTRNWLMESFLIIRTGFHRIMVIVMDGTVELVVNVSQKVPFLSCMPAVEIKANEYVYVRECEFLDGVAKKIQNAKPAPKGDQAAYVHTVKAPGPSLSLGVEAGLRSSIAGQCRGPGGRARACVCTCRVCVCACACRVCSVCGDECGVWKG